MKIDTDYYMKTMIFRLFHDDFRDEFTAHGPIIGIHGAILCGRGVGNL